MSLRLRTRSSFEKNSPFSLILAMGAAIVSGLLIPTIERASSTAQGFPPAAMCDVSAAGTIVSPGPGSHDQLHGTPDAADARHRVARPHFFFHRRRRRADLCACRPVQR